MDSPYQDFRTKIDFNLNNYPKKYKYIRNYKIVANTHIKNDRDKSIMFMTLKVKEIITDCEALV
jgi:hypothetical protein